MVAPKTVWTSRTLARSRWLNHVLLLRVMLCPGGAHPDFGELDLKWRCVGSLGTIPFAPKLHRPRNPFILLHASRADSRSTHVDSKSEYPRDCIVHIISGL